MAGVERTADDSGLPANRLDRIAELTEAVSRATSLSETLELALSCLEQALGVERASVLLFDDSGSMRFVAWHGLSDRYRAAADRHSPWSREAVDAKPILVSDTRRDASLAALWPALEAEAIGAVAFIPLRAGGKLMGKFMLYYREPHEFGPHEVALAQIVAGHVAFAVERRQRDTEVARARDDLEATLRSVSDGITLSSHDGKLLFANDAAARVLGGTREQLVALPTGALCERFDVAREDGRPLDPAELPDRRALRERVAVTELICLTRKADGACRWVLTTATPLFQIDGYLAVNVFRDVTEQREKEVMLREREQKMREAYAAAREAERRKDEFLAILGHELRNPLAPIVTALQLMELKGKGELQRERTIIERQVEHLRRLVDDLLDISRITRGTLVLRRRPISLASVVREAVELAEPLIAERRQILDVSVPDDLAVSGDAYRLTQVFANLISNASQATPERGHLSVTGELREQGVELRVRDDGAGIEPELMEKLFDLFVQGKQSLSRDKGGLGLGLTIVKRLTELHGGTVSAESEGRGKGSCFTVRLPAAHPTQSPGSADVPTSSNAANGSHVRVLVVDDNAEAADTLGELLAAAGFETRVAYDGPSALAIAEQMAPDVAILDIGMPVMDGYELAEKMRETHGSGPLRLLALTGYGQEQDRNRSLEAGFDAHLVKPVELREILANISGDAGL